MAAANRVPQSGRGHRELRLPRRRAAQAAPENSRTGFPPAQSTTGRCAALRAQSSAGGRWVPFTPAGQPRWLLCSAEELPPPRGGRGACSEWELPCLETTWPQPHWVPPHHTAEGGRSLPGGGRSRWPALAERGYRAGAVATHRESLTNTNKKSPSLEDALEKHSVWACFGRQKGLLVLAYRPPAPAVDKGVL